MFSLKRGFTLIELLVVIAIIALLSSVVLASLTSARMKARDARRISDLRQIAIAISMYSDANGEYPSTATCVINQNCYIFSYDTTGWSSLQAKLSPYISKLPVDPINSSCQPWTNPGPCYSYAYGNPGNGKIELANASGTVSYDLATRLETPSHPQGCGRQNYSFNFGKGTWCSATPVQMYDGSLD